MTEIAPDRSDDGPALKQLTEKQRTYLLALLDNGGNQTAAALVMNPALSQGSARAIGSTMAHNPKLIAAMKEEADRRVRIGAPLAIDVMLEIMNTPGHKDRFKAAVEVANRSGLLVIHQSEVLHTHAGQSTPEMLKRIELLARQLGVDPVKLLGSVGVKALPAPKVVDAEFVEVVSSPADPFAWSPE